MNTLCLNCRGCGRSEAVRDIRNIVDMHNPVVLFLSETKMSANRSQDLRWRLGFPNAFGVNCDAGLGGGLVVMWKNKVNMELKTYSKYHIDMRVTENAGDSRSWRFTGFYGDSKRSQRKESWRMLRFLRNESDLPWLCAGDFNEILHDQEQFGGNDREEWKMEGFREAVQYCGFTDLGYSGTPFTWDNRREWDQNIKVRLDRALADERVLDLFGDSSVTHVQTTESDHCAILITLKKSGVFQGHRRERPFRYENMWLRHPSYEDTVAAAWGGGCLSLSDVHANLGGLQNALRSWDKNQFGSVRNELKRLRRRLETLRKDSLRTGPTREERGTA